MQYHYRLSEFVQVVIVFDTFPPALLFSATFRKKIERLCRDVLTDPVRIVVGDLGEANTDITQVSVCVCVCVCSQIVDLTYVTHMFPDY